MSCHPTDDSTDDATDRDLAAEVDALRERLTELEARVDGDVGAETETTTDGGRDPREFLNVPADHRDAAVVGTLHPGETYGIYDLRDAYRRETDIRAKDTLRERTKSLLQASVFERVGNNRLWRFRPPASATVSETRAES